MGRWKIAKERVPEKTRNYLVHTSTGKVFTARFDAKTGEWSTSAKHCITHWMNYPKPPREER